MAVIGIDFGSSYTSASWLNPKSGCPEAIMFANDHLKIPSLMLATPKGFLVGNQAYTYLEEIGKLPPSQRFEMMENFIPNLKGMLDEDTFEFFYGKKYSHGQLLSIFLAEVIKQAQCHCGIGYPIDSVVFTHPVDFSKIAINVIKTAFESLELNVEWYLTEPESAVRGYHVSHNIDNNEGILVFDFGGGTTDVAYVKNFSGELNVATVPKGNRHCGGNDIDQLIYEYFRKRIIKELGYDITQQGMVDNTVLSCCRKLKEQFSGTNNAYEIPSLLVIEGHAHSYNFSMSRNVFNSIIYSKVSEAVEVARQVVLDVKAKGYVISKALLIGGSSQLTLVQRLLAEQLGDVPIDTFGEKDIAVALGTLTEHMAKSRSDEVSNSSPKTEVDMSVFRHPLKQIKNCIDGGGCMKCGSNECYKLVEPMGEYRCLKCGWQGKNIKVTHN